MKPQYNPYIWQRVEPGVCVGRHDLLDGITRDHYFRPVSWADWRAQDWQDHADQNGRERAPKESDDALAVIPVYVDVLAVAAPFDQDGFYRTIVAEVDTAIRRLGDDGAVALGAFNDMPTRVEFGWFRRGLAGLIARLRGCRGVRIAVLFDEVEPIVRCDWGGGFFSNWRSLISNTPDVSPYYPFSSVAPKKWALCLRTLDHQ